MAKCVSILTPSSQVSRGGAACVPRQSFCRERISLRTPLHVSGGGGASNNCATKKAAGDDHLIRLWSPPFPLVSPVPAGPAKTLLFRPPVWCPYSPPSCSVCTCTVLLSITLPLGQRQRTVLSLSSVLSSHHFIPRFPCCHQGQGSGPSSVRL